MTRRPLWPVTRTALLTASMTALVLRAVESHNTLAALGWATAWLFAMSSLWEDQ